MEPLKISGEITKRMFKAFDDYKIIRLNSLVTKCILFLCVLNNKSLDFIIFNIIVGMRKKYKG